MLSITKMNVLPPGGYQYKQPETGMEFSGNEPFRAQCLLILAHRKGNNLARATYVEVSQDLIDYTCGRVPAICNATAPTTAATAPPKRRCGSCGGRKAKA